jgi:hypothetical protein
VEGEAAAVGPSCLSVAAYSPICKGKNNNSRKKEIDVMKCHFPPPTFFLLLSRSRALSFSFFVEVQPLPFLF